MVDGQGRPTDSIIGGNISCALDQVWTTCGAVVSDVDHGADLERKRLLEILHWGETDLVDDKDVRER